MDMRIIRMAYLPEEADEDGADAHVFHYLWAWKRMTPGAHKIHDGNIPKLIEEQEKKWGLRCRGCNRLRDYSDSDSDSDSDSSSDDSINDWQWTHEWTLDFD